MRSVGAALVKLIATATSGLVSFTTNVIRPVKVICEFNPVQEGTGDPSPDNVRPISGWTGCEVYHTGKNIWWTDYTYNDPGGAIKKNGEFIATNAGVTTTFLLGGSLENNRINFKLPKGTYSFSAYSETFSGMYLLFTDGSTWYPRTTKTFDKDMIVQAVRCNMARLAVGTYRWEIQIEQGAECTDYEPYQGETLPITFTDPSTGDPLTVYGGTVTLNEDGSADLVATQALWVEDGTRQPTYAIWQTGGEGDLYNRTLFGRLPRPQHDYAGGYAKYFSSDNRKFTNDINDNEWRNKLCFASYRASGFSFAYSIPKNLSTKAEVAAYFAENPTTVVYALATPITYHFDNIGQLQSFLGTNNIWHNMNGSITAEYYKKQ